MMKKYLEKLPQDIKDLINTACSLANKMNLQAYIVGGLVRDLFLGVKNLDLDIVIEDDGIGFAEAFANLFKAKLIRHRRFGTATVILKPGLKIDIASARREIYPEPASLPQVVPGTLMDDLLRRDFSINAMAIKISGKDFGKLIDLFSGREDLASGKIRVLHELSFIDDPIRILRAVRFEKRYNFHVESKTLKLLKEASRIKMLDRVEPQRLRDELIMTLKEAQPLKQMRRLQELVGLRFISSGLSLSKSDEQMFGAIRDELHWFREVHTRRRQLDFWLIYFMSLLDGLSTRSVKLICRKFAFLKGETKRIISYKKVSHFFILRLSQGKIRPADIFDLLEPLSYEVILLLKAKYKNPTFQKHINDFFEYYNGMHLHIRGDDLARLGLQPGPEYQEIFKKVLKAKLNGLVKTKEEELVLIGRLLGAR
ncbi:CCA tRNA nucleotidyltransferase [bacterium]|nr:MAG: CCA tRNA nucleotidyltransferase [bacterium]